MGKNKGTRRPVPSHQPPICDGDVCKAVDDLWLLLQNSSSEQLVCLWEEYDKIQVFIQRLRDLQGPRHAVTNRADKLPAFEMWLKRHGAVYCDNLAIIETPDTGLGLQCLRDLKSDEKVLQIPEGLMMSSQTALAGALGVLVSKDQMLKSMTNVTLALHLLNEKHSPDSFWKPYIDTLPHSFSLPLFFSKEELLLLKGSPCLVKCLLQVRNITKLYSHLHKTIRVVKVALPIFESGFKYDDFIWAVSCVMSRQNEIPSKPTLPAPTLALIPLWDLCNHCNGHISTYFNVETSTCDCYAQQDFSANEEFRIFYGGRTNLELLLQQGFVYPQNEFDSYHIKLGLSSMEDPSTRSLKLQLLQLMNLPMSGSFLVSKSKENPFSPELCAFVRIFKSPLNILKELVVEKDLLQKKLKDSKWNLDDLNVLEFLEKRCSLLLMQYPTTISEDQILLKTKSLSANSASAILMRLCEKNILVDAVSYAKVESEKLKTSMALVS